MARIGWIGVAALGMAAAAEGAVREGGGGGATRAMREQGEMVFVPGGVFAMGLDAQEAKEAIEACRAEVQGEIAPGICDLANPNLGLGSALTGDEPRRVSVRSFWIDRFEVTTRQYRECVAAGACDPRPLVSGDTRFIRDEWPVVNVSWFDAVDYCRFRGKRLPTEAEWEKAARGVDARRFPWGSRFRQDGGNFGRFDDEALRAPVGPNGLADVSFTVDDADGVRILAPPGSFPWGRSPYGVHDLAGNVSEWVADWYSPNGYESLPRIDPTGPPAGLHAKRVVRGGSFLEPRLFGRTYYRHSAAPTRRAWHRGFRCARDAD